MFDLSLRKTEIHLLLLGGSNEGDLLEMLKCSVLLYSPIKPAPDTTAGHKRTKILSAWKPLSGNTKV